MKILSSSPDCDPEAPHFHLINQIIEAPEDSLSDLLTSSHFKCGEVANLSLWIKPLNRFDRNLREALSRGGLLATDEPTDEPIDSDGKICINGRLDQDIRLATIILNFTAGLLSIAINKEIYNSTELVLQILWAEDNKLGIAALSVLNSLIMFPQRHRNVYSHITEREYSSKFADHPHWYESVCDIVASFSGCFRLTAEEIFHFSSGLLKGNKRRVLNPAFSLRSVFRNQRTEKTIDLDDSKTVKDEEEKVEDPLFFPTLDTDQILVVNDLISSNQTLGQLVRMHVKLGVQSCHRLSLLWRIRVQRMQASSSTDRTTVLRVLFQAVSVVIASVDSDTCLMNFFADKPFVQTDLIYVLYQASRPRAVGAGAETNETSFKGSDCLDSSIQTAAIDELLLDAKRCVSIILTRVEDNFTHDEIKWREVIVPFNHLPAALGFSRAKGAYAYLKRPDGSTGNILASLIRQDLLSLRERYDSWLNDHFLSPLPSIRIAQIGDFKNFVELCEGTFMIVVTCLINLSGTRAILIDEGLVPSISSLLLRVQETFAEQETRRAAIVDYVLKEEAECPVSNILDEEIFVTLWLGIESFLLQILEALGPLPSVTDFAIVDLIFCRLAQEVDSMRVVDGTLSKASPGFARRLNVFRDCSQSTVVNYLSLLISQISCCEDSRCCDLLRSAAFSSTINSLLDHVGVMRDSVVILQYCLALVMGTVEDDVSMPTMLNHFFETGLIQSVMRAAARPSVNHTDVSLCRLLDFVDMLGLSPLTEPLVEQLPWPREIFGLFRQPKYLKAQSPLMLTGGPTAIGLKVEEVIRHHPSTIPLCLDSIIEVLDYLCDMHENSDASRACFQSDSEVFGYNFECCVEKGELSILHLMNALLGSLSPLLENHKFRDAFCMKATQSIFQCLDCSMGSCSYLLTTLACHRMSDTSVGFPPNIAIIRDIFDKVSRTKIAKANFYESLSNRLSKSTERLKIYMENYRVAVRFIIDQQLSSLSLGKYSAECSYDDLVMMSPDQLISKHTFPNSDDPSTSKGDYSPIYKIFSSLLHEFVIMSTILNICSTHPHLVETTKNWFILKHESLLYGDMFGQCVNALSSAENILASARPIVKSYEYQVLILTHQKLQKSLINSNAVKEFSASRNQFDMNYMDGCDLEPGDIITACDLVHLLKYFNDEFSPVNYDSFLRIQSDSGYGWIHRKSDIAGCLSLEIVSAVEVQADKATDAVEHFFFDKCFQDSVYEFVTPSTLRSLSVCLRMFIHSCNSFLGAIFTPHKPIYSIVNGNGAFRMLQRALTSIKTLCMPTSEMQDLETLIADTGSTPSSGNLIDIIDDSAKQLSNASRGIQILVKLMKPHDVATGASKTRKQIETTRFIELIDPDVIPIAVNASINLLRACQQITVDLGGLSNNIILPCSIIRYRQNAFTHLSHCVIGLFTQLLPCKVASFSQAINIDELVDKETGAPIFENIALFYVECRSIIRAATSFLKILQSSKYLIALPHRLILKFTKLLAEEFKILFATVCNNTLLEQLDAYAGGKVSFTVNLKSYLDNTVIESYFYDELESYASLDFKSTDDVQILSTSIVQYVCISAFDWAVAHDIRQLISTGSSGAFLVVAELALRNINCLSNKVDTEKLMALSLFERCRTSFRNLGSVMLEFANSMFSSGIDIIEKATSHELSNFRHNNPFVPNRPVVARNIVYCEGVDISREAVVITILRDYLQHSAHAFTQFSNINDNSDPGKFSLQPQQSTWFILAGFILHRLQKCLVEDWHETEPVSRSLYNLLIAFIALTSPTFPHYQSLVFSVLCYEKTAKVTNLIAIALKVSLCGKLSFQQHEWLAPAFLFLQLVLCPMCMPSCTSCAHVEGLKHMTVGSIVAKNMNKSFLLGDDAIASISLEILKIEPCFDVAETIVDVPNSDDQLNSPNTPKHYDKLYFYRSPQLFSSDFCSDLMVICCEYLQRLDYLDNDQSLDIYTPGRLLSSKLSKLAPQNSGENNPYNNMFRWIQTPENIREEIVHACMMLLFNCLKAMKNYVNLNSEKAKYRILENILVVKSRFVGKSSLLSAILAELCLTPKLRNSRISSAVRVYHDERHQDKYSNQLRWNSIQALFEGASFELIAEISCKNAVKGSTYSESDAACSELTNISIDTMLRSVVSTYNALASTDYTQFKARLALEYHFSDLVISIAKFAHIMSTSGSCTLSVILRTIVYETVAVIPSQCLMKSGQKCTFIEYTCCAILLPQQNPTLDFITVKMRLAVMYFLIAVLSIPTELTRECGQPLTQFRKVVLKVIADMAAFTHLMTVNLGNKLNEKIDDSLVIRCIQAVADTLSCLTYRRDLVLPELFQPRNDEIIAGLAAFGVHQTMLCYLSFLSNIQSSALAQQAIHRIDGPLNGLLSVGLPIAAAICEKKRMIACRQYCLASPALAAAQRKIIEDNNEYNFEKVALRAMQQGYDIDIEEWWELFDIPTLIRLSHAGIIKPDVNLFDFDVTWEMKGWRFFDTDNEEARVAIYGKQVVNRSKGCARHFEFSTENFLPLATNISPVAASAPGLVSDESSVLLESTTIDASGKASTAPEDTTALRHDSESMPREAVIDETPQVVGLVENEGEDSSVWEDCEDDTGSGDGSDSGSKIDIGGRDRVDFVRGATESASGGYSLEDEEDDDEEDGKGSYEEGQSESGSGDNNSNVDEETSYDGQDNYGDSDEGESEDSDDTNFDENETNAFSDKSDSICGDTNRDTVFTTRDGVVSTRYFFVSQLLIPFYYVSFADLTRKTSYKESLLSSIATLQQGYKDSMRGPVSELLYYHPLLAFVGSTLGFQYFSRTARLTERLRICLDRFDPILSPTHWGCDADLKIDTVDSKLLDSLSLVLRKLKREDCMYKRIEFRIPESSTVAVSVGTNYVKLKPPLITIIECILHCLGQLSSTDSCEQCVSTWLYQAHVQTGNSTKFGDLGPQNSEEEPVPWTDLLFQILGVTLHPVTDPDTAFLILRGLLMTVWKDGAGLRTLLRVLEDSSPHRIDSALTFPDSLTPPQTSSWSYGALLMFFSSLLKEFAVPVSCILSRVCPDDKTLFNNALAIINIPEAHDFEKLEITARFAAHICFLQLPTPDHGETSDYYNIVVNPDKYMPLVLDSVLYTWCELPVCSDWGNKRFQDRIRKIILFLSHKAQHWNGILQAVSDISRRLVMEVQDDMFQLKNQIDLLLSRSSEGTISRESAFVELNEIQCPSSALRLLSICRLAIECTGIIAKVKPEKVNQARYLETNNETYAAPTEKQREALRGALAEVVFSDTWALLRSVLDSMKAAYSWVQGLVPESKGMSSRFNTPKAGVVDKNMNFQASVNGESNKTTEPPSPRSGSNITLSGSKDSIVSPGLIHLFPMIDCYCTVLSACLLVHAPPAGPTSVQIQNNVHGAIHTPSRPFREVDATSASADISSISGKELELKLESLPIEAITPGVPGPRSLIRLDSTGLNRTVRDQERGHSDRLSFYSPLKLAISTDTSSTSVNGRLGLAKQFVGFLESHASLLNCMLSHDIRLLETSLSVLRLAPECRMHLGFERKKRYFDLQVRRLKRRATDLDCGAVERPFGLEDFYSRHQEREQRRQEQRDFVNRDHDIYLEIDRKRLLESSFAALTDVSPVELLVGQFEVTFEDEEGVDGGGLTREWLSLLTRELFKPQYGLFVHAGEGGLAYQPNPQSEVFSSNLPYFKFTGRMVGKALVDGHLLDVHFTRPFYKHMLGAPVGFSDLRFVDEEFHKNLSLLLSHPLAELGLDGSLTFSTEDQQFGNLEVVDLIPDGRNISVTDSNKAEYVNHIAHHRMTASFREQTDAFLEGFHECVPAEAVSLFDANDLELLISGLPDIDIEDLRSNTRYTGYKSHDETIRCLWSVLRSFSKEEKALFVQFVTGTSQVPLGGFASLQGSDGVQRFSVHKSYGDLTQLPTAHTCFNQLDLPDYRSEATLRAKLMLAIHECSEGFGFS